MAGSRLPEDEQSTRKPNAAQILEVLVNNPIVAGLVSTAALGLFGLVILVAQLNDRVNLLEEFGPLSGSRYTASDAAERAKFVDTRFLRHRTEDTARWDIAEERIRRLELDYAKHAGGGKQWTEGVTWKLASYGKRLDHLTAMVERLASGVNQPLRDKQ